MSHIVAQKQQASKNYHMITISLYALFTLFGVTSTVIGPTIVYLMRDYSIEMGSAGLFVSFMAAGRLSAVLLGGVVADRYGRKPVILTGIVCWIIGLSGIGSISQYYAGLVFAYLIGTGNGMVGTSCNAAIADLNAHHLSNSLNRLHMFFALGCLIGPLMAGTILSSPLHWRSVYYFDAMLGLILFMWIVFLPFPQTEKKSEKQKEPYFADKFLWGTMALFALIPFIYSGSGASIDTWINKYMGDIFSFSVLYASGTLAIYNLGLLLGRLLNSIISDRVGVYKTILLSSVGALICIYMVFYSNIIPIIIVSLLLTGIFFGGLLPTTLAIVNRMFPQRKGMVTGLMVAAASLGGMTLPASVGFVAQTLDVQYGLRTLMIYVSILVVVSWILNGKMSNRKE